MLTLLTFLALAGSTEPARVPPTPQEKPKLICRTGEQEVGSHIHTSRTCKTAEQWQQDDARRDQRPATYKIVPGQGDGVPRPQRPPL